MAPILPSVWDDQDRDDDLLDGWVSERPLEGHGRPEAVGQGGGEATKWRAAEVTLGHALARAAAAVARLDERLASLEPERRTGAIQHLALLEIADLVWAEGARLRPERLALVDLDRAGRTDGEAEILGRAAWAFRRARTRPSVLDDPEAVAHCLGRRLVTESDRAGGEEAPSDTALVPLETGRAEAWLDAVAPLADLHPLSRAGAGFSIWRRGRPDRVLEAAALAWSLALAPGDGVAREGLSFLPLALGQPATRLGLGGGAEGLLAHWFAAVEASALAARRRLLALDAWRARAGEAIRKRRGRGAAALADLFLARPILSAPMAAQATGLTAARTRDLLAVFEAAGLVREMTGHARFRYWQVVT